MTTALTFANAQLPTPADLAKSLSAVATNSMHSGDVILKMDKAGIWVYGADQTDVEEDSQWAVNPYSFIHGFIAWGDGTKLGEKMGPITEPLPDAGAPPPQATKGWEPQAGFSLRCMSGEDEGLEVRYSVSSVGGRKAVAQMIAKVVEQIRKDPVNVVPVVELGKDHYSHKQYGRIYTPVFDIKKWVPLAPVAAADAADAAEAAGAGAGAAEADAAPASEGEPRRRRRG